MEEEDAPELIFSVEEDPNRKDQLFTFRKEPPTPTNNYHAKEQQLLQEGKLGNAEFSARLRKVVFGTFDEQPACLILFRIDFATAKKGWFRFRNATIDAEFEEALDAGTGASDEDEDEDDIDDQSSNGLLIRKIYPELVRGHIASAAKTLGLGFDVPLAPMGGVGLSAEYRITAPREGLHLIQGRLMGSPETRAKWNMNENEVSKGGIYEQPQFAVIVRHARDQSFTMSLKIKATTYGRYPNSMLHEFHPRHTSGLPVTGKGGSRILFRPSSQNQQPKAKASKPTSRLTGGSFEVGTQQWTSPQQSQGTSRALDAIDLETETQMRATLLSEQGPGAGQSILPLVAEF
ncbi:MAG: hypothetical protein Q9184_005752 [Pyrenodesmia sp. 2 TL-2023]